MSSIKKHVVRGGRRRMLGIAVAICALVALVGAGAAFAIRPPSPELVLAPPTVTCTSPPTVNLSWTDTKAGEWYRPLSRTTGSAADAWNVGAWASSAGVRSMTAPVANGQSYDFAIEAWGSGGYRNSNARTIAVNCGGATTTVAPTTTRPPTTTIAPTTTSTTRPPTTTAPPTTTGTAPPTGTAWSKRVGSPLSDSSVDVATDAAGNVYQLGIFRDRVTIGSITLTSAGESDIFLAKYNSTGGVLWAKRYGSTGNDSPYTVAVDNAGNVTIGGLFAGTTNLGASNLTAVGQNDLFLAQYNGTDGTHRWSKNVSGSMGEAAKAIAIDGANNIYVTGYFQGAINFGTGTLRVPFTSDLDVYVAKFNSSGTNLWAKNWTNNGNESGDDIAVTPQGEIAFGGNFSNTVNFGGSDLTSPNAMTNMFVTKLNTNGGHIWSKSIGDPAKSEGVRGVAVDGSGNVVITGYVLGAVDFGAGLTPTSGGTADSFVAKYASANGAHQWSKRFGSIGNDYGEAVKVDASGNVYAAGSFEQTVGFGGAALTSAGNGDIYLAKYSASGAHLSSRRWESRDDDENRGFALSPTGHPLVAGYFYGSITAERATLTSAGMADALLIRTTP